MTATLAWSPSRRVFMRRIIFVGALTFGFFMLPAAAVFYVDNRFWVFSFLMPVAMTLIFLLEDFSRWRSVRTENWEVAEGHLVHDGPDGRAMIPLAEIDTVATRLGNVVIRLATGQRIMMRYLPDVDQVVTQLDAARPK